jgi:Fe-S-cluster containining protein
MRFAAVCAVSCAYCCARPTMSFRINLTASKKRDEQPGRKRDANRGEGVLPHSGAQILRRLGQVLVAGEKFAAPAVEVRGGFSCSSADFIEVGSGGESLGAVHCLLTIAC